MSTSFNYKWLEPGAAIPVDIGTTSLLAAELHRLYAECHQWRSVFGHLGTPDEIGNEWIALQDAVKLKDALLRQALETLIWTTGSSDFCPEGKAREGAMNLLFPTIIAIREHLEGKA